MMISKEHAEQFAANWIASWNSHDMDRIMTLYADDFTIQSPTALAVVPHSGGFVAGKEAIKSYWLAAMKGLPGLEFELLEVFIGIGGVALHYINKASGKKVIEAMTFNAAQKVAQVLVYHKG
jgi:ketosteroid isomerase-like protein